LATALTEKDPTHTINNVSYDTAPEDRGTSLAVPATGLRVVVVGVYLLAWFGPPSHAIELKQGIVRTAHFELADTDRMVTLNSENNFMTIAHFRAICCEPQRDDLPAVYRGARH